MSLLGSIDADFREGSRAIAYLVSVEAAQCDVGFFVFVFFSSFIGLDAYMRSFELSAFFARDLLHYFCFVLSGEV